MNKLVNIQSALQKIREWKDKGERIVFTNGCFDILHAGHVKCLESAKKLGDRLIVGLNSDPSVRKLKGRNRPVNNEADRGYLLSSLETVDMVILFDDPTPTQLIKVLSPDVLVKGADYKEADLPECQWIKSQGGTVAFIPMVPGQSTTLLIRKLRNLK